MKPVKVNMLEKKNTWTRISLGLVAALTAVTCAVTLVNTYDYFENTKIIRVYEKRVKELNQRKEIERREARNRRQKSKEQDRLTQELSYFSQVTSKSMFPLIDLLSNLERIRPGKVRIDSLVFSDNLKTFVIKGSSGHVSEVTRFIIDLGHSDYFDVQLSKEEITEKRQIAFELTARWTGEDNG